MSWPNEELDDCLENIKEIVKFKDETIAKYREENRKLKDGVYKDEEIKRLREQNTALRNASKRGFLINDEEYNAILSWEHNHSTVCDCNQTSYRFFSTPFGTIGEFHCESCGAKLVFKSPLGGKS